MHLKAQATLIGALVLVTAAFARPVPAAGTDFEDAIEYLRAQIGRGRYRAVADTVSFFVEDARALGDSLSLARLTCLQGQAELGVGRVDHSLELLESARNLAIAQRDTLTWMTTMGVGSFALGRQGRYVEAIELSAQQMELAHAARDTVSAGFASLSIGFAELQLGNPDRARPAYQHAIDCFGGDQNSSWRLTALVGLARAESDSGELDAARAIYGEVLERSRNNGDLRHEIDTLNNLAAIEFRVPRVDLAVGYLRLAHERLKEMDAEPSQRIVVLGNLVHRSDLTGDDESILAELDTLRRTVLENGDVDAYTAATLALARARRAQHRYRAAATLFDSVRAHATTTPVRQVATLGFVDCSIEPGREPELLELLSREFASAEDIPGPLRTRVAARLTELELSSGNTSKAIATAREFVSGSGADGYGGWLLAVYARALARNGDAPGAADVLAQTIGLIETRSDHTEDPAWKWVVVTGHHRRVVDAAAELLLSENEAWAEPVFELLQRLKARTMIGQLRPHGESPGGLDAGVSLARVQKDLISPGEVVLDYFLGQDHALVFAIDRDHFRACVLEPSAGEIESTVASGVERLLPGPDGNPLPVQMIRPGLARISSQILAPVADLVQRAQRVTISPDGILASVPFGLLVADQSEESLIQSRTLEHLPCIAFRTLVRRQPGGTGGLVTLVGRGPATEGTRREVRELAGRMRVERQIEGLADPWPDEFGHAGVLHIAAHADVSADRPWLAGFHLEAGGVDSESGLLQPTHLRAHDLLNQELSARIAVLSACESGVGRLAQGEGVIGISSAFLMAGCWSVVSTLWPVDDAVTVDFMLHFYDALADGHPVAEALRQAQLRVRANDATAHPYYWAGFVVIGDGAVIADVQRRRITAPRAATSLIVTLVVAVALWYRNQTRFSRPV